MSEVGIPAEPGPPPRKGMSLIVRVLWGIAGLVMLSIGGLTLLGALGPSGLPACDNDRIQASLRERVGATAGSQVTAVTNFRTGPRTETNGQCTAHMTFADGRQSDVTYSLVMNGRTVNWEARNLPIALPACDAQSVQDLARRILQEQNNVTATSFANIRTLSRTPQEAGCQMDADFGPRGTAQLRYTVSFTDATHFQVNIAPTMLTPAARPQAPQQPSYGPQQPDEGQGGYGPEAGGKE